MTAITLKQKLLKSRQLWKEMYDAEFLADLYEVLDVILLLTLVIALLFL